MTLRVFKTGSPSVRFYYLLTVCVVDCAYLEVSLRGTFTGVWWRRAISGHTVLARILLLHSLDTLEFHISLPLL